eukprot:CAMPEP_0177776012 /NCGR_PEP_ID=MMETSP0491_2-20121128/14452_1 /TAXON_ID=63592 /ORGANISM="Tetraselmis chuii, Strain PLY429" /LENGTH=355 /DNA_ID=CAMNT_0019294707 /DNA_START=131 /DNA_END=1195 /DNA_ORIENTATION=+
MSAGGAAASFCRTIATTVTPAPRLRCTPARLRLETSRPIVPRSAFLRHVQRSGTISSCYASDSASGDMSSQRNGGEERLSSGTGTSRGAAYCTDDGRSEVSARSNSGSATSASSRTESAVADVNVELVEVTSGNSVINEVRDGGRVRASEKAVARDEFNRGWMDGDKAPSKEQLANRRRRMRYRRNKRAQSMAAARGFTKLIRMYQKQKRPWKIMEGICAARAGPPEDNILNCINYNAALNALVELGDIDSAKAVFQWIEEDVGPDVVALSSMIKAFGKADAIDEAFALLDDYEERTRSTAPRRVYMNLLNACAYVGDVQRSRAMMHRIKIMEGVEVQRTREKLRNFNQYAGGDA